MELAGLSKLSLENGNEDKTVDSRGKLMDDISDYICEHSEVYKGLREVQKKVQELYGPPLLLHVY